MQSMKRYELDQSGVFSTDRMRYAPLDMAEIAFECRNAPLDQYFMEVYDGAGRKYFEAEVPVLDGVAEFSVTVGGAPGLHIIRAFKNRDSCFYPFRMGSFVLDAETSAQAEGTDLDAFVKWLRMALEGSLDWALYEGRWVAGDKCADNSPMNMAYPRFRLNASVHFESAEQLKGSLDLVYAHQMADGSLYGHIYGDGSPGDNHLGTEGQRMIRSMMADMETGCIINVWQVWMATGDMEWMKRLIDPMLRGWRYATSSPDIWSERHRLIKRPHTADEWDVQTGDNSVFRNENSKYVIAICDAVRMPKAADCLASMLAVVGRGEEAEELRLFAMDARRRANSLLWDGTKYRHHHHIDPMDHAGFDESNQLAMSNTWACTDGLANHDQAVAIIDEYERRLTTTGGRYPWWSLQPGYPDGWFPRYPQGMYCNGGLFPWVGGELCRACFQHGFPERGWRMFREFWEQVKSDKGACVTWYTLDGHAAASTPCLTNYDAWGVAAWGHTVVAAVLGVTPLTPALGHCRCVPQWRTGGIRSARACVAMPASRTYFAYIYDRCEGSVQLRFTGSGDAVDFMIPACGVLSGVRASLDGEAVSLTRVEENGADYLHIAAEISGIRTLLLEW